MGKWLLADKAQPWAIFYPLAWCAILFVLSSIPGDVIAESSTDHLLRWLSPPIQNALHIPVYAVLAMLWCRVLRAWGIELAAVVTAALLLTVAYGFLDEWRQAFVPGRYSSMGDLRLNIMGAVVGICLYLHFARKGTA